MISLKQFNCDSQYTEGICIRSGAEVPKRSTEYYSVNLEKSFLVTNTTLNWCNYTFVYSYIHVMYLEGVLSTGRTLAHEGVPYRRGIPWVVTTVDAMEAVATDEQPRNDRNDQGPYRPQTPPPPPPSPHGGATKKKKQAPCATKKVFATVKTVPSQSRRTTRQRALEQLMAHTSVLSKMPLGHFFTRSSSGTLDREISAMYGQLEPTSAQSEPEFAPSIQETPTEVDQTGDFKIPGVVAVRGRTPGYDIVTPILTHRVVDWHTCRKLEAVTFS